MKHLPILIVSLLVAVAVAVLAILLYGPQEEEETSIVYYSSEGLEGEAVLDNGELELRLDRSTTRFVLTHKESGTVWRSNPEDPDVDPIALPREKGALKSPLLLSFITKNGVVDIYDTHGYSVERNLYSIEESGDSITVNYCMGDVKRTYIYPPAISAERMETFFEKMSDSDRKFVQQRYRKYDLENLRSNDNRSELLDKYPVLKDHPLYEIRDGLQEYLKDRLEKIFRDIGYTSSEFDEDTALYAGGIVKNIPIFNVSVNYRLDGDDLIVDIPFDKIAYKKEFPPVEVTVLPYMGSGSMDETGYLFVPEGSGALIDFNNGKLSQSAYYADVYGWDHATDRKAVIQETDIHFPVYGIAKTGQSFVSIIENGASYAGIQADIAGKRNARNVVYAKYRLIHTESFEVSGKSNDAVYVFEKALPEGEHITQRYQFLNSDSYVDMAHSWGDFVAKTQKPATTPTTAGTPVIFDVITAIDKRQQFMGFPRLRPVTLTTFKEATSMVEELKEALKVPLHVRLRGAINGGLRQKVLSNIKPTGNLGGTGDLKEFFKKTGELGVTAYLDGEIQYARNSNIFNGFFSYRDAARFASSELAKLYKFSKIWYGKEESDKPFYLLSPAKILQYALRFDKYAQKIGAQGISLSSMGRELSADYDPNNRISREEVMHRQTTLVASIRENDRRVMTSHGNNYLLGQSDILSHVRLRPREYSILDRVVPFWSIALHDKISFTGMAINISDDWKEELLVSAESGAGLAFTLMAEDATALQDSEFTSLFGADYQAWKSEIEMIYADYNRKLGTISGARIIAHQFPAANVSKTIYANGTTVYVNYGYEDMSIDGIRIAARDFVSVQE